jgi:hypothetical protein
VAAAVGLVSLSPAAGARSPAPQAPARIELWTGAEAFHRVWSLYMGGAYAPFGSILENGFRVRAVAGYGDYGAGTVSFADLLLGYHAQLGRLTVKVLAGLTIAEHHAGMAQATLDGSGAGAKAVLETWWNVTDRTWLSTDLSLGSLHDAYGARVRLGWRLFPAFSLGLEGGAAGALGTDVVRAGGFARYEWATGEVSFSGGLAVDGPRSDWESVQGPFATISVLTRF